MGHTQFMPTTYQKHAVDFDGDGKARYGHGTPRSSASTANYLSSLGWRKGQRWGFEVELPPGFDYSLADETTERPLSMWIELGLRGSVIMPRLRNKEQCSYSRGRAGPAFLLLPNFRSILGYNTAMSYALSVAHLSDRLRGAPPFAHDWPRQERMLSSSERRELQSLLTSGRQPRTRASSPLGPAPPRPGQSPPRQPIPC